LHLNIVHDEASTIIPEQKEPHKHLCMHVVLLAQAS